MPPGQQQQHHLQQQQQNNQSLAANTALNLARSNSLGVQAAANAQANVQQAAQQLQLSQHHQQQQQQQQHHLQQQQLQHQQQQIQNQQNHHQQQQMVMGMRSGLSGGSIASNQNMNGAMLHAKNLGGGSSTPGGSGGGGINNSSSSNPSSNSNSNPNNNPNFIQPSHPHHPHHQAWLQSQHQASYNLQIQQQQQQQLQNHQQQQQHAQLQQLQLQQQQQQQHAQSQSSNNPLPSPSLRPGPPPIPSSSQIQQPLRVQTNFPPQQSQSQSQQQQQPSSPAPAPSQPQAQDSPRPLKSAITMRSVIPPLSSSSAAPGLVSGPPTPGGRQQQQTGSAPPTPGSIARPSVQMIQVNQSALAANLAISGNGPITATASILGPGLAKLTALNESLTKILEESHNNIEGLRNVVNDFFTDTGILKYGLFDKSAALNKVFEIPCSAFPRFQHINSICGVLSTSLNPTLIREFYLTTPDPSTGRPIHVGYLLKAEETIWSSRFSSGVQVELKGSLMVHFVVTDSTTTSSAGPGGPSRIINGLKIESIDFDSKGHEEFIVRESLVAESIERLYDSLESSSEAAIGKPTKGGKKSTASGGAGGTAAARRKSATKDENDDVVGGGLASERQNGLLGITYEKHFLPESPVGSFGVTEMGMRCLEIAESVAQLQDLIAYSLETNTGPIQSLAEFVDIRQQQLQQSLQLQQSFSQQSQPPTPLNGPIASNSQSNPFYSSIPQQPHSGPPSSPRAPGINSNLNSPPSSSAPTPSNSGGGGTKRKNTDSDLAPAIPVKGTRGRGRGRGRGMV